MKPQPTAVQAPIQIRIADDLRMKIESGELRSGDSLPTLQEICDEWQCSTNSARAAISLLKQQGLITVGRGKAGTVRAPARRIVRSSARHQAEKDLVPQDEDKRRTTGLAETDLGISLDSVDFSAQYTEVAADQLAATFEIALSDRLLRRVYEMRDRKSHARLAWSVSYIPLALLASNPALLDDANEPWPGGTQHQLSTVGVELAKMIDEISAFMPSTAEVQQWRLETGVPLLRVRRLSIDSNDRVVEISDADYPADRTELSFTTYLKPW